MFFEVIRSRYYTAAFTLPRLKYLLSSYGADVERRICGPLRWLIPFFRILRPPSISNPSNLSPLLHINPWRKLVFFSFFYFRRCPFIWLRASSFLFPRSFRSLLCRAMEKPCNHPRFVRDRAHEFCYKLQLQEGNWNRRSSARRLFVRIRWNSDQTAELNAMNLAPKNIWYTASA